MDIEKSKQLSNLILIVLPTEEDKILTLLYIWKSRLGERHQATKLAARKGAVRKTMI